MLPTEPVTYVSIIASNLLFPITKLLESLGDLENTEPNEVQCSPTENGFSLSVIVLSVLLIESVVNRIQYLMQITPPEKPLAFIKKLADTKNFLDSNLSGRLEELFVIRDVIVHSHVWEAKVYWDRGVEVSKCTFLDSRVW